MLYTVLVMNELQQRSDARIDKFIVKTVACSITYEHSNSFAAMNWQLEHSYVDLLYTDTAIYLAKL